MKFVFIALLATLVLATYSPVRLYSGYRLVKITTSCPFALNKIQQVVDEHNLDIWSNDGHLVLKRENDILVPAQSYEQLSYLQQTPNKSGSFTMQVVTEDVQPLLDAFKTAQNSASNDNDDFFSKYRTYDEISQFTKDLQQQYSSITKFMTVGSTWENREIYALFISTNGNQSKPTLLLDGLQHAREWIAAMTVSYAMKTLLEQYTAKVPRIVQLLEQINIIIVPIVNPDGYAYTFSHDRLWRKNRRNNGGGVYGVDLNRNWQIGYGIGASKSPSSITYQGPHSLSEPESIAYDKFIRQFPSIKAGIDFHSYSELVLRPWDYQEAVSADEQKLKVLGASMQEAIFKVHGVKYQNIRGVELYPAGGALNDQFYGEYKFAGYTIELRDTGRYGFLLPPDQIIPTSEENYQAILVLGEYVTKL